TMLPRKECWPGANDKSLCWCFKLQGLTWPFVELTRHFVQMGLRHAVDSEPDKRVTECWLAYGNVLPSIPEAAVCGKAARAHVCPGKASMFSRGQSCRGRSQSPVVRIAEVMETETLKPIDKVSLGEINESPGRNKSKRVVASKVSKSEGRARIRRAKAA